MEMAHAAGLPALSADFGLGLLPLPRGVGELGLGAPPLGAAGAASDLGAGVEGFSMSLCWNRHLSPREQFPSFQNLHVALIFFLGLSPFGDRDLFL